MFAMMIITGILAGFLSTMNVYSVKFSDVSIHINDMYMVLLMTCWMMLFYSLYIGNNILTVIFFVFVLILFFCIRKQIYINDTQYLKGMIPHHSMAILMSEKILEKTEDPKVKLLAQNIIDGQRKEIEIMDMILDSK
jgi:Ca2+/Na+ antiporter